MPPPTPKDANRNVCFNFNKGKDFSLTRKKPRPFRGGMNCFFLDSMLH